MLMPLIAIVAQKAASLCLEHGVNQRLLHDGISQQQPNLLSAASNPDVLLT